MKRKYYVVLLATVLLAAAWRILGLDWDNYAATHPDERFVASITGAIGDEKNLLDEVKARCPKGGGFFDTRCTAWNPVNVSAGSFAYGTLPVFIVREVAQGVADVTDNRIWASSTAVPLVGRSINVFAEMLTVVFIFLIGRRLFGLRQATLAAMLYAGAVLPIQLAHFWAVDIIAHLFFIIALYCAVIISQRNHAYAYLAFGAALGAAMASRANLAVAAILMPVASAIYLSQEMPSFRQLDATEQRRLRQQLGSIALKMAGGFFVAFWVFRLGQPYAFDGPGVFNIIDKINLNPPFVHLNWSAKWRADLAEVANLASRRSDGWPPSHQWVGRIPYLYPWYNFVWGMGPALWLTGTAGLVVALFSQFVQRRLSPQVGLIALWFVLYFGWQGQLHFMTLRYYLPLYAGWALLAAWWLCQLQRRSQRIGRAILVGGTFLWAFTFTGIYRSPQTRVEAAYWMRDHIPAMVNGRLPNGAWVPLGVVQDDTRGSSYDLFTIYHPRTDRGRLSSPVFTLDEITYVNAVWLRWVERVEDLSFALELRAVASDDREDEGTLMQSFPVAITGTDFARVEVPASDWVRLEAGQYRWELSVNWSGTEPVLHVMAGVEWLKGESDQFIRDQIAIETLYDKVPYYVATPDNTPIALEVQEDTTITQLYLVHQLGPRSDLTIELSDGLYTARYLRAEENNSLLGEGRYYALTEPITLKRGTSYLSAAEPLWLTGTAIATEGDWDDATPARICWHQGGQRHVGHVPFRACRFFGAYDRKWLTELHLQVVIYDSEIKHRLLQDVLAKADYMAISTNRMYDALVRNNRYYWYLPAYYEALFEGRLGYEQVARFALFPHFGPLTIPDQVLPDSGWSGWMNGFEAEEAFTVYDHPTVYIFKKVDFTAAKLPPFRERFDERNRIDLVQQPTPTYVEPETAPDDNTIWRVTALWGLGWLGLGWLAFPMVYLLLPELPVRGYAFVRAIAWMVLAFVPWWLTAASGLPFWRREALVVVTALFFMLNGVLAWRRRDEFFSYLRQRWRMMVVLDLLWLAAFGFGIVLRGVMPDLWHPYFGGEKHMDLAYLHATLRTETFPPPNPWMSGFSINYYYLGFVIIGMPLKLFAIAPEAGPNLALATLYATVFLAVAGLLGAVLYRQSAADEPKGSRWRLGLVIVGTAFIMLAGTYGTAQRMINPEKDMAPNRWYWYPTRIIAETRVEFTLPASQGGGPAVWGGEIINEFPVFSFLYGDPHAHTIGLLPVLLLLAALWAYLRQRSIWLMPVSGGLLGMVFMTNVWDILVYVPLVAGIALYILITTRGRTTLLLLGGLALGGIIAAAPYLPHFTTDESASLRLWHLQKTPLEAFLLVWGGPVLVIVMWVMNRIKARAITNADFPVEIGMLIILAGLVLAAEAQAQVTVLIGILLLVLLGLMIFDGEMRSLHLFAAFFLGGLLAIDYVTINDDRVNTGFKVSYQLWLLAGLMMPLLLYQMLRARRAYLQVALCLVALAPTLLFCVKAIPARQADSYTGRFTLNGYDYMQRMPYLLPSGVTLSVAEDQGLIRYMRAHLRGYPVIAEAYQSEYQWNGRIASYTGLPSVVGWQNHLRQQFPHQPGEISRRVQDMFRFYATSNAEEIRQFISLYDIDYIVSGTLEQSIAEGRYLVALQQLVDEGTLAVVYQNGSTLLYQVRR